jgi:polysaccharide biosynthesis/export protein
MMNNFYTWPGRQAALGCALVLLATSAWGQRSPLVAPAQAAPTAARAEPVTVGGSEPAVVNLAMPAAIGLDYRIAPNDLIEMEVFGVSELKRTVRVNAIGAIALPLIGTLQVAGLTPADAEALIAIKYGQKYLQDPQVSLFIKEFTTQRITVDGAVVKPGIFPLTGQITLLRALALAGGGGPMADMEQVMLFRIGADGQNKAERYDAMKIRKGESPDPPLQGDDIIVVNRDNKRTALRDSLFRDIIDTLNPFAARIQ